MIGFGDCGVGYSGTMLVITYIDVANTDTMHLDCCLYWYFKKGLYLEMVAGGGQNRSVRMIKAAKFVEGNLYTQPKDPIGKLEKKLGFV